MLLVDVHAHLDDESFSEDIDEVIERAKEIGVKIVIAQGIDPVSNRKVLELCEKYDIVKGALGIYPTEGIDADFSVDEEIGFIEEALKNNEQVIAIGEVGLEYKETDEREQQQSMFRKFVELSKKLDVPIIIHSRKAEEDVIDILEELGARKVVLHCFCGKKRLVKRAAELGYSFSIPPTIVRAQQFQMIVELVDISQLLTETDSPYLSPFRDKRNEPAFVMESVKKMAEIKKMTAEEVGNTLFMNYQKMFL